jgi:hypothetical protein
MLALLALPLLVLAIGVATTAEAHGGGVNRCV